jgi:hypothetical protein
MYFKMLFKNLFLTKNGRTWANEKKNDFNEKLKVNAHLVGYEKEYSKG